MQRMTQNENLYIFCIAFHIFATGNRRRFTFGMQIDHSMSQLTHDKLSLNGAWSRQVMHFKLQGLEHTSGITEARLCLMLPKG